MKEPFWPGVQCVEGGWSPSQNNVLSKDREEGKPEVKWHAPGHRESKWQSPAKHQELLYSHFKAPWHFPGSQLRNPLQTSQSSWPKGPRPSISLWDAAAAMSRCVCIGHSEVSVSRTSPNYSFKQEWQNSLHSLGNNLLYSTFDTNNCLGRRDSPFCQTRPKGVH